MKQTKYIFFLSLVGLVVALDQFTKFLVLASFSLGESQSWIPGAFSITRVHNTGAAFGILANIPAKFREPFFLIFPTMILISLFLLYRKVSYDQKLSSVSLVLIFGGAVGNLLDRVRLGFVVDFLDFYINALHFPAFNIADCAISLGVILWILGIFLEKSTITANS